MQSPLFRLILASFLCWSTYSYAGIPCPSMPSAVTEVNRDVVSDVKGAAGVLGPIKGGEIGVRTEIVAKNLFEKYPNVDQLLTLQTLAATYCAMLRESRISDPEKLDRWELFQERVLNLQKKLPTKSVTQGVTRQSKTSGTSPATPISLSDRVLKDDNPTKLQIERVEIKDWLGDSEPYVTVAIKNSSKRTALSVRAAFFGEEGDWTFTPTKTSTVFANGVSIEPQGTTEFPIAPVSEFLQKLQTRCAGCYLAAIGKEANFPDELLAKVCEPPLKTGGFCSVSSLSTPTWVVIRYGTIFDEKTEQRSSMFSYLTRNIPTSYQVPLR